MSQSGWFESDPSSAWGFYSHRQHLYANAIPHSGFDHLKELLLKETKDPEFKDYFIMTSNVDSQFQTAGFPEEKIFETHGTLAYQQCTLNCEGSLVWKDKNVENGNPLKVNPDTFRVVDSSLLPTCPKCKNTSRPNVSFFSDTTEIFNDTRQLEQKKRLLSWLEGIKEKSDEFLLVIEIGCGTSIHSLRFESEILLYHTPKLLQRVALIRLNPTTYAVEENNIHQVGIGLGAKSSLTSILPIQKT